MQKFSNIYKLIKSKYTKEILFVVKLLSIYFVLNLFFTFITGVTISGGSLYSEFIAKYLNIVDFNTKVILHPSKWILKISGYQTYFYDNVLGIEGGNGIRLMHACLGFQLVGVLAALIFSFPADLRFQVRYFILGTFLIQFLNVVRIVALIWLYSFDENSNILSLDQHDLFNGVVMTVILFYFVYFLKKVKST